MKSRFFVGLGNSLVKIDGTGILSDVVKAFDLDKSYNKDHQIFVLAMEGDPLLKTVKLPEGAEVILVKEDGVPINPPAIESKDTFILNGGRTPQNVAISIHLTRGCTRGRVFELQQDGVKRRIFGRRDPELLPLLLEIAEDILSSAYHARTDEVYGCFYSLEPLAQRVGISLPELEELVKERWKRLEATPLS